MSITTAEWVANKNVSFKMAKSHYNLNWKLSSKHYISFTDFLDQKYTNIYIYIFYM